MSDPAIVAGVDQAHAQAEDILTQLVRWWIASESRAQMRGARADEVALLTHLLEQWQAPAYALLATALCRLADKERSHNDRREAIAAALFSHEYRHCPEYTWEIESRNQDWRDYWLGAADAVLAVPCACDCELGQTDE